MGLVLDDPEGELRVHLMLDGFHSDVTLYYLLSRWFSVVQFRRIGWSPGYGRRVAPDDQSERPL